MHNERYVPYPCYAKCSPCATGAPSARRSIRMSRIMLRKRVLSHGLRLVVCGMATPPDVFRETTWRGAGTRTHIIRKPYFRRTLELMRPGSLRRPDIRQSAKCSNCPSCVRPVIADHSKPETKPRGPASGEVNHHQGDKSISRERVCRGTNTNPTWSGWDPL